MANVVFVNHLPLGSASSYRQEGFAKCLRNQGFHTTLVCRSRGNRKQEAGAIQGARRTGQAFERTFFWEEPIPLRLVSNVRLLSRAIEDADIVHVNRANPYTATILTMVRTSSDAAVVVDQEDWDGYGGYSSYIGSHGPKGWVLTGYERTFPRTADAVIVVSALLRDYMVKIGVPPEKLFVIHNGFDGDLFTPNVEGSAARARYGLSNSPVVMYSSAYWEFERKQHETAFAALGLISREMPDARLLMTGKEALDVASALRAEGIAEKVVRPGFVPRFMMPGLMAAADVAIHIISSHPFHGASSPMIIPEYMAMGKPIVAPRIGELRELLGGGAGVLLDNADAPSIARAAIELLRDTQLRERIGKTARLRATQNYSYQAETVKLRKAYDQALSLKRAG